MRPKSILQRGAERPQLRRALVLLSGGLDSVALLHWARPRYRSVAAVTFGYGQVNRDAETTAAGVIAARLGMPATRLELADAVRGLGALSGPAPGLAKPGVSHANLPGRNPALIAIAAAHAARLWPDQRLDLLIGATRDDAEGFPDCRRPFVKQMSRALALAMDGVVRDLRIVAPWVGKSKADVVAWCAMDPAALRDVRQSVSCYRGTRCDQCDACLLRARAFAAVGVDDGPPRAPRLFGDAGRDARLR